MLIWTLKNNPNDKTNSFNSPKLHYSQRAEQYQNLNPKVNAKINSAKLRNTPFDNNNPANSSRIKIIKLKDSSIVKISSSHIRDKDHQTNDFVNAKQLRDNSFDYKRAKAMHPYNERLKFLRNQSNLSENVVNLAIQRISEFVTDPETRIVPATLGYYKEPRSIFINEKTRIVAFRDYKTNNLKTALRLSRGQILALIENDFNLFPNAGRPKN